MRKTVFFLLFVLFGVLCFAQQAKLDFPVAFDLGKISGKDCVTVEIPISNPSDERVSFTTVSSCNCIEINNFTSSIPANSSVFVPITFHPEGYSGNQSFIVTLIYNGNREKILLNCEVDSGNLNETAADIEDNVFIHYTSDEKLLNQSNSFCFFSYKNCGSCKKIIKTFLKIYPNTPIYFFELENPDNAKLLFEKLYDETFSQLPVLYKTDEDASRKVYSGENEITDFFYGETKSANKNKIRMNAVAIFISGLLDGVNPCAFTVIILLLSYMTLNFRKKSEILVAGIFYVTTVFITYFLVGLGLFEFIKRLEQFALFQMIFKYILSGFLAVLAVVSLFDAIQCARGKREDMLLKLPTVLQKTIRENIRSEMKNYRIFLSSVLLGFLVSLLELACTGQVYLPIVGYMVRSTPLKGLFLLFLYNLGFIIPLAFVFFLVYRNISSKKIGDFFSSHLVAVKILFCLLFVFFFVINIIS
ncbi:MAG: DUF1573 domain-containing protein [Spirochaetales bacterium]|nr:DUF1573 domain-containing protein [Spirochaetales bacterium]